MFVNYRKFLPLFFFILVECVNLGGNRGNIRIIPEATIIRSDNYKILGISTGESSCLYLFGMIPISKPINIQYAISQAVQKVPGGISMINIKTWTELHSWNGSFLPIFVMSNVLKVSGDVIGYNDDTVNSTINVNVDSKNKSSEPDNSTNSSDGGISVGSKKKRSNVNSSGGIGVGGKK